MLYVATVHYKSPRWVEIQTRYLREHISVPFQIWSSLELIDPAYSVHFDRVLEQLGIHAGKLNNLAIEIAHEASDDDLVMFLDGDAFPIADPMPLITDGLAKAPLIAVRRAENAGDPQPHPCFCVTTVGTWRKLPGDWCSGYTWPDETGGRMSDVGANLLRQLQLTETPWVEVLRSNRTHLDPLYFAVYGDTVYHHGAGFRTGEFGRAHRELAPQPVPGPKMPALRSAMRRTSRESSRLWERRVQERRRQIEQSNLIFEQIQQGGSDWLSEVL